MISGHKATPLRQVFKFNNALKYSKKVPTRIKIKVKKIKSYWQFSGI
jgi:hypothetical protein